MPLIQSNTRATPQALRVLLLLRFLEGNSAASFVGFVLALNEAVKGKKLRSSCPVSAATEALLEVRPKRTAGERTGILESVAPESSILSDCSV